MSDETLPRTPPVFHVSLEGYLSTTDAKFLDVFEQELTAHGFDPSELIFSGFDGSGIDAVQDIPKLAHIYGMNEVAWKRTLQHPGPLNAARHAEEHPVPCIGLYDRSLLREVASAHFDGDTFADRIELTAIVAGDALEDLAIDQPISGPLVHKDYPERSPTDALVGLVFIDP